MIEDTTVVFAKSIVFRRSCIVAARADFDPHDRVVSSSPKKKGLPVTSIASIVRYALPILAVALVLPLALLAASKGQGVISLFLAVVTVSAWYGGMGQDCPDWREYPCGPLR
jgi:hypothetical protein